MVTDKHDSHPPAAGERNAMSGYYNQYHVSAYITLKQLQNDCLEWIKVADTDAKTLDDFQISSGSRLDAFQVKWELYPGPFSFTDLTSEAQKNLIKQLADGWKHLMEVNPGKRVVVHLITNQYPHNAFRAKIPCNNPIESQCHFAAFIEQAWVLFKKKGKIPDEWRPAWEKLRERSDLTPEEFDKFVLDCELDFKYQIPKLETGRKQKIFVDDLEKIHQKLSKIVSDASKIIKLNREELLEILGWSSRLEFRSSHTFPVDESIYHPITSNVNALKHALSNLSGGYIGVFGTPGSGKSTFLSNFLRSREERVIFYYAYIPEAHDSIVKRGESENFLHDVVLSLRHEGFVPGNTLNLDRNQLLDYFFEQLSLLHNDWKEKGQKTIILIDGLDHITREQNPQHSLLNDLPSPEQIPDGVYFILGSQTDTILPDRIQYAVTDSDRRIIMDLLNRSSVFQIIEKAELPLITATQKEKIFDLSGGHPLALSYIINSISDNAHKDGDISDILNNTEKYGENIEAQYHSYWREIEEEYELKDLLGLLSRLRGYIDIPWINTWAEAKSLHLFTEKFSHYFRKEDNGRWYFFHNSFRLFLQEKTKDLARQSTYTDSNSSFHHEIANKCFNSKENLYWSWEEIYHRFMADEHEKVLKRASQSYFRDQFFKLRPIIAIKNDIKYAFKSAAFCQDHVAFTRLILISTEIEERSVNLDIKSIISILISLDKNQIATEYFREGNNLRIEPKDALNLIPNLISAGLTEESKKIYDLAEPITLLNSNKPIKDTFKKEKAKILKAWANSAIFFKDIDEIIRIIRRIEIIPDKHSRINKRKNLDYSKLFQNTLLLNVGLSLLEYGTWDDLLKLINEFNINKQDMTYGIYMYINAWLYLLNEDKDKSVFIFKKALKKIEKITITDFKVLLYFAEAAITLIKNESLAKKFIKDVPQPDLFNESLSSDSESLDPFMHRFLFNRILYALGNNKTPVEIIPENEDPTKKGIVEFERLICDIAYIWSKSWRDEEINSDEIKEKTNTLLDLFNSSSLRSNPRFSDWSSWYNIKNRMGNLFELYIKAVEKNGSDLLEILKYTFEEEWKNENHVEYWSTNLRRQIILSLNDKGINPKWCISQLKILENGMLEDKDLNSKVEECIEQSKAWIKLGENDFALINLENMLKFSFGIYYSKDYQLSTWIEWSSKYITAEPDQGEKIIKQFINYILLTDKTTDGRATFDASTELLATTFRWSPLKAVDLSQWFTEASLIQQESLINVMLLETLKTDNPPLIPILFSLTNLLFPITNHEGSQIISLLLKQILDEYGKNKLIESASYMVSKISTLTQQKSRFNLFYSIKQELDDEGISYEEVGIKDADLQENDDKISVKKLELENSEILSQDEVKMRVSSVSDLHEFLKKEKQGSFFKWESIIKKIIVDLSYEDSLNLNKIIHNDYKAINEYKSSKILEILSKKFSNNNDNKLAWELGIEALNVSNTYGWIPHRDGGSRLSAFRALINADKYKGRKLLYETLTDDIYGEFLDSKSVALNLDKILPLIMDEISIKDIWLEIEEHLKNLFGDEPQDITDCPVFTEIVNETPSRAITCWIISNLDHPVNFISQMSKYVCSKLLIRSDPLIQSTILEFLKKDEIYQEDILMILDAVSIRDTHAIMMFYGDILSLCNSKNFFIQQTSKILVRRIGNKFNRFSLFIKEKYDYIIYRLSNKSFSLDPKEHNNPKDSYNDPTINLEIGAFVKKIAKELQISEIEMWKYIDQIIRELNVSTVKSRSNGEYDVLKANLDRIGLNLEFKTHQAKIAHKALFYAISNLISSRFLNPLINFKFYDPFMILEDPYAMPNEIKLINKDYSKRDEEWVKEINFDEHLQFKQNYGFVLAEHTILKSINWEYNTDIHESQICLGNYVPDKVFFETYTNNLVIEYPKLHTDINPSSLVIRCFKVGYSYIKEWVAINPVIAHQLGWHISNEGLFRWVDDKNKVMVESIWWKNGLTERQMPPLDNTGEGWIVVASPEAWKSIKSKYSSLKRLLKTERYYINNGRNLVKNSKIKEMNID